MAKVVGLVGSASGKIGNIVYAVTNGIQVARVYQPVVSNPKSPLQSRQRAKGNIAGRISSFVPKTAILGLGSNNRTRRGEFLRNILKSAVVSMVDNVYVAKVDRDSLVFSKGDVQLSITGPTFTPSSNLLNVYLNGLVTDAMSSEAYESMQTRLVVCIYDATTEELVEVVTKIANKPTQGQSAVTVIPVVHPAGYIADVYAVPMSTADGSNVSIDTSLVNLDDNEIAANLSVNANAVVFNYGKSVFLGEATFTPAP